MKYLTITVPCYNSEKYLRRCLDSLTAGGNDVEVIVVNDGSADRTGEIAESYAGRFPEIVTVVHKENGGHGSGVNTVLFVRLKEESIRRLFWHHKEQLQLSCHIIREQFCILSERKIPPCKLIAQGYSVFCYKNGSSSSSVREAESLYRRYSYSSPFSFRNSLNVRISQPRNVWASQRNFRVSFREPWSAFLSV